MVDDLGVGKRLEQAQVVETWNRLAGASISRITRSVRLQGDHLIVSVTSAAWRNELHLQREAWKQRLNEGLPPDQQVREILFR